MAKTETLDNHIIRSIIQPLEKPAPRDDGSTPKSFTTEPKHYKKRGCNTVRSRSMFFVDHLKAKDYTFEIPLEKAKELFSEITGEYDRITIKRYFGTLPGRSTRKMRRYARYQSGTQSVKDIELSQNIQKTKGYLEKLGLATYERHGKVWFMILENREIVSEFEGKESKVSNDKIYLTLIDTSQNVSGERSKENHAVHETGEVKHGCL